MDLIAKKKFDHRRALLLRIKLKYSYKIIRISSFSHYKFNFYMLLNDDITALFKFMDYFETIYIFLEQFIKIAYQGMYYVKRNISQ